MAGSTRAECYLHLNDAQETPSTSTSTRPSLVAPVVVDDPGYNLRRHLHQAQQQQHRHHRPPVGFGAAPSETESRRRMADILLALAPNLPSAKK